MFVIMLKEDSDYRYFVGYYPHREDGTKHPVFGFYNRKNGGVKRFDSKKSAERSLKMIINNRKKAGYYESDGEYKIVETNIEDLRYLDPRYEKQFFDSGKCFVKYTFK